VSFFESVLMLLTKNCQNWSMLVETTACQSWRVFWDTVIVSKLRPIKVIQGHRNWY